MLEVTCRLDGRWRHRAGQFAFLTCDRLEGQHPFTLSAADRGNGEVSFTIKALDGLDTSDAVKIGYKDTSGSAGSLTLTKAQLEALSTTSQPLTARPFFTRPMPQPFGITVPTIGPIGKPPSCRPSEGA